MADELTDDVARLIDAGQSVAWRVDDESAKAGSEELARRVMRTWKQWTFDTETPKPQIDLVVTRWPGGCPHPECGGRTGADRPWCRGATAPELTQTVTQQRSPLREIHDLAVAR